VLLIDAPGDPPPRHSPHTHLRIPPSLALAYLAENIVPVARVQGRDADTVSPSGPPEADAAEAGVHPLQVALQVRDVLQPDDIIVLDGGEFAQWIRYGLRDIPNRVFWNSKLGGIGGGIPFAVGIAATGHPGRTIIFVGDGAAGYHLSEFETAARYSLPIVAIVGNDGRWAAEWHMQVSRYGPDRAVATNLLPARYDAVARGFGAMGDDIHDLATLRVALAEGLTARQPTCLNVHVPSAASPAVQA
jgi:acetolactate synthase-1/2/3 large subunit